MKSICIVSSRYPTSITPSEHVFVKQLVWELADLGINCTVISPLSVNQNPNFYKVPVVSEEKTNKGSIVNLRFPRYISFGQKKLGNRNTVHFTTSVFHKTVLKEIKKLKITPDVVYGHFLAPSGVTVSRITKELSIPSFVAFGESTPWSIHNYGLDKIKNELKHVSGVISVSTENKKILGELNVFPEDIINVFPNGVRNDHYYQRDKKLSREKMGFKEQDFIVAFVGRFNERKGALRVLKAVNDLDEIKVAFAGDGDDKSKLVGNKVIYNDRVTPELMPYFLSAADVFVLPTLNEGCSNAIIEAMSCGLPIISSDLPCNEDILNNKNAILIDPENTTDIKNAILKLYQDEKLLSDMAEASIKYSESLTLKERAIKIVDFINEKN